MPKIYTELEKNNIYSLLRKEGRVVLKKYGVKKSTVDEIVTRVNIPKGTFYLFYPTKEALFLDLIDTFRQEVETLYLSMLQELDENKIVTSLTKVFTSIALKFYDDGIFRFLDPKEFNLIKRKYDGLDSIKVFSIKEELLDNLFSYFYIDDKKAINEFSQSFEALLYIFLNEEKIPNIEARISFLIRGLVLQLVE